MSSLNIDRADQLSFDRFCQSAPVWTGIETAADAVGLDTNVLLHAGPPFDSAQSIPRPILNSACVAAVFEGLADNFNSAEAMIGSGEILLKPAQDLGIVTPLAAVVSSKMPMHQIIDLNNTQTHSYAPLNGGSRPAMRLGLRSEQVLEHIRWLNQSFADYLASGLKQPLALIPIAAHALRAGDDCHGYTPAGSRLMMKQIEPDTPGASADANIREFVDTSPSLFLNVWMAASKCMMKSAAELSNSSFVTALAGNGLKVGMQVSGLPGRWFQVPAEPPLGRFDVDLPSNRALPAIGDSAVVEGVGLGAMALHCCPTQARNLGKFMPPDYQNLGKKLMTGHHPGFDQLDCPLGLTARAVLHHDQGPAVGLGILDKLGENGRLGGGVYQVPSSLFAQAVESISDQGKTSGGIRSR